MTAAEVPELDLVIHGAAFTGPEQPEGFLSGFTAPADGKISTVFPTGHAVGITTADGAEILIHIGLDTVELKGEPFEQKVKEGQDVKKGDLLVVADLDKIKASGRETITPMIICNSDAYEQVETFTGKDVETTDAVMKLHPAK